jgi:hypothetical protein
MLIELLLSLIYTIFDKLMIFNIPQLPEQVQTYINSLFDYLVSGASILANYTPLGYLMTLFGVIVSVDIGINVYKFVMWILKKIPMINIK